MTELTLNVGTKITYKSAAGVRKATVKSIVIGPTGRRGHSIPWITLDVPVQPGVKFATTCQIPGDAGSLGAFFVQNV